VVSKLCLAASTTTILDRRKFEVDSAGDPILDIPQRSMSITKLDNIGFRCHDGVMGKIEEDQDQEEEEESEEEERSRRGGRG
jgi:hypothetical protein